METLIAALRDVFGLDAESLTIGQIALRTVSVYIAAIALMRLGEKRFLGNHAVLDAILGFMLGSLLSRAITDSQLFIQSMTAAMLLVLLHWLTAVLAFYSDRFGTLVKGSKRLLVKDGEICWSAMRASNLTRDDLQAALRVRAQLEDPSQLKSAYLERSGDISAIERHRTPRVFELQVKDGVQFVRIRLE